MKRTVFMLAALLISGLLALPAAAQEEPGENVKVSTPKKAAAKKKPKKAAPPPGETEYKFYADPAPDYKFDKAANPIIKKKKSRPASEDAGKPAASKPEKQWAYEGWADNNYGLPTRDDCEQGSCMWNEATGSGALYVTGSCNCKWQDAMAYCENRTSQLPAIKQLKSLHKAECTLKKPEDTCGKCYWSADLKSGGQAGYVCFIISSAGVKPEYGNTENLIPVRCVPRGR